MGMGIGDWGLGPKNFFNYINIIFFITKVYIEVNINFIINSTKISFYIYFSIISVTSIWSEVLNLPTSNINPFIRLNKSLFP